MGAERLISKAEMTGAGVAREIFWTENGIIAVISPTYKAAYMPHRQMLQELHGLSFRLSIANQMIWMGSGG